MECGAVDNPTAKPATDLRTRIITAMLSEDDVALMADAVIRELELTEERATTDWPTPDGERAIATRVVSEWQHLAGCKCGWCVR